MMVKFTSINEEIINFNNSQGHKKYFLSVLYVNPQHIVLVKEDLQYVELLVKKMLPEGFPENQKFSRILLNRGNMGEEFTALGDIKSLVTIINEANNGN